MSFSELPLEIRMHIASYIPKARAYYNLSMAGRAGAEACLAVKQQMMKRFTWRKRQNPVRGKDVGRRECNVLPNGWLHGPYIEYYRYGQVKRTGSFHLNKKEGKHMTYSVRGKVTEEYSAHEGKYHGPRKQWWLNGQLLLDTTYVNGQLDGTYSLWWRNGQKQLEYTFKAGKIQGKAQEWHEDGTPNRA